MAQCSLNPEKYAEREAGGKYSSSWLLFSADLILSWLMGSRRTSPRREEIHGQTGFDWKLNEVTTGEEGYTDGTCELGFHHP